MSKHLGRNHTKTWIVISKKRKTKEDQRKSRWKINYFCLRHFSVFAFWQYSVDHDFNVTWSHLMKCRRHGLTPEPCSETIFNFRNTFLHFSVGNCTTRLRPHLMRCGGDHMSSGAERWVASENTQLALLFNGSWYLHNLTSNVDVITLLLFLSSPLDKFPTKQELVSTRPAPVSGSSWFL